LWIQFVRPKISKDSVRPQIPQPEGMAKKNFSEDKFLTNKNFNKELLLCLWTRSEN
jgi:hypothetical protein